MEVGRSTGTEGRNVSDRLYGGRMLEKETVDTRIVEDNLEE
jgi:hypothetical protein